MKSRRLLQSFVLAIACWLIAVPLSAMSIAGRVDRRAFMALVTAAFEKEDYETLEATIAELLAKKDHFPDGTWTAPAFYDALELPELSTSIRNLDERLAHWKTAYPRSIAERIVELNAVHSRAKDNPGMSLSLTSERLAQAEAALHEPETWGVPLAADWHNAVLRQALREGVGRKEYDLLFERAIAAEPGYLSFYFNKAFYLWNYAPEGEWEAYALEAGRKNLSGEGIGLYSRIAWCLSEGHADSWLAKWTKIQWPLMREGFRELDRRWPDSEWNLNNFCRFACLAGDRETARELFARIDDNRWTTNWLSRTAFKDWRTWASAKDDPTAAAATVRLVYAAPDQKKGPAPQAWTLCFAPDSASLFVGYDGARLVRWDLRTGSVMWQAALGVEGVLNAITISPDQRWLVAGTGARMRAPNVPGAVGIWNFGPQLSAEPARWLENGECGVHCLRFSPDSQTLAASGLNQIVNEHGELRLWSVANWQPAGTLQHPIFPINRLAFLPPDGRRLAFNFCKGFNVLDAATVADVFVAGGAKVHETFVSSLAASPDGRTIACGTCDGFEDRDHPGEVAFWSTGDWNRRETPHITAAGGVESLDYSPDGRWLLGGGYDGILRVWDAATGKVVTSWPAEPSVGKIYQAVFSPDGQSVAAVRDEGATMVYRFMPPALR